MFKSTCMHIKAHVVLDMEVSMCMFQNINAGRKLRFPVYSFTCEGTETSQPAKTACASMGVSAHAVGPREGTLSSHLVPCQLSYYGTHFTHGGNQVERGQGTSLH